MSDFDSPARRETAFRVAAGTSRTADMLLGGVAAVVLFAMMAITAVDVFGRYVFNAPLQGSYELTQLLMAALIFSALPTVTRRGEHITVGLFENAFSGWARAARDGAIALVVAAGSAYLAWRLYILAGRFSLFGDTTATVRLPLSPFAYAGAGAMALCTVAALALAAEAFIPQRENRPQ
jgi:TRAP-type transport system small permease protein